MPIHPSAIVSKTAKLGENITIGPFAIIADDVVVGDGCRVDAAAQLMNGSRVGNNCRIGSGSLISADPHYIGFDESITSGVVIGDNNIIREYVTLHRSVEPGGTTVIGNDNFLMNGAHVGHDCILGNGNTLANNALLGGHVSVGDFCFLGGGSAFHQFVRIGSYVMAQGLAGASLDVPPYLIIAGINNVFGINTVGLKRAGLDQAARKGIKEAYQRIYRGSKTLAEVLEASESEVFIPEVEAFYDFFRNKSTRGVLIRSK
ncbi:MAG: acyl-[acyl-carrier-protein]--UDP-N-acetylglucosamine O-acyltransferase [Verrucomicrobiales bacterium]|nr:acyl-[acyl-carrier-protein]--UDP-N-acetylglucosamine O-acyltransferase [Verrucomicrobiales bacterium]|tara:strand:- start:5423 stop:6202 length:780 start_codon:yes stop_codon:yes gene_type:complete